MIVADQQIHDRLLLTMFINKMSDELEAKAIEAIRPAVKTAVASVLVEMQPQVEVLMDQYKNRMVVELVTREVKDHG